MHPDVWEEVFYIKFNYLFHPRGGVQNPDNKINTRRLRKRILVQGFPNTPRGNALLSLQGQKAGDTEDQSEGQGSLSLPDVS